MFCGHPSLRFGDVIHFIELWGNNPNNTIVFTEPSFSYLEALAPFQPLQMKTVHCPIDTSLNFNQAKKLIRDLKPGMIAIPECYAKPPESAPTRTDLSLDDLDIPRYTFGRYETIDLPLQSRMEKMNIDPELAARLKPVEIRPGVQIATITGNLVVTNNKCTLEDVDKLDEDSTTTDSRSSSSRKKRKRVSPGPAGERKFSTQFRRSEAHVFGGLDLRQVLQKLKSLGYNESRLEELTAGRFNIHLVRTLFQPATACVTPLALFVSGRTGDSGDQSGPKL